MHSDKLQVEGNAACIKNSTKVLYGILDKCDLLKRMGEYDRWGEILKKFDENSKGQTGYYYVMSCVEMWMDYYKTIEQKDNVRALQNLPILCLSLQTRHYILLRKMTKMDTVYIQISRGYSLCLFTS